MEANNARREPNDDEPGDRHRPKGGIYVDLTARRADGSIVREQLVDTLADGVTPTVREKSAAARIRAAWPRDELRPIPKARTGGASLGPGRAR